MLGAADSDTMTVSRVDKGHRRVAHHWQVEGLGI